MRWRIPENASNAVRAIREEGRYALAAVVVAALRNVHGAEPMDQALSLYYVANAIALVLLPWRWAWSALRAGQLGFVAWRGTMSSWQSP